MLLEWPEHSKKIIEGVNSLHKDLAAFHDVTLSAEGKQIKAHRVILAAASTYFKELLLSESQNEDRFPIVFLKDVKYVDIECLVKYIYTGKTEVTAANMASCTQLAETLGITGFAETLKITTSNTSPSKKRKSTDLNKENIAIALAVQSPKTYSASEPVNMPESNSFNKIEHIKRRKIHSLDNVVTPPPAFKSPKSVLQTTKKSPITKKSPSKPDSPVKKSHNHSCPVESPVTSSAMASATASAATLPRASMINNVSFNSMLPLMSPEQLAFQGASILQSLALWMEQEQRREGNTQKEVEPIYQNTGHHGPPPPPPPNSLKSNPGSGSTIVTSRRLGPGESESGDRPDSGFDSKDEEEVKQPVLSVHQSQFSEAISEEAGVRTASSGDTSPDLAVEISRQAPIRQPVIRKRRLNQ